MKIMRIFAPDFRCESQPDDAKKAFVLILCRICPNYYVRRIIDTDDFCSYLYVSVYDLSISKSMDKVQRFLF